MNLAWYSLEFRRIRPDRL